MSNKHSDVNSRVGFICVCGNGNVTVRLKRRKNLRLETVWTVGYCPAETILFFFFTAYLFGKHNAYTLYNIILNAISKYDF